MKVNEPYLPKIKSKNVLQGLAFRTANSVDCDAITELSQQRNPLIPISEIMATTKRELQNVETDPNYRLFVATFQGQVIAFCRVLNCWALPEKKIKFPAPRGWYGMGLLVSSRFRRQGVAEFLHLNRMKFLKENSVTELFTVVDSSNLSSIEMHRRFGFEMVSEAKGFLHIEPESGSGYLFRLTI